MDMPSHSIGSLDVLLRVLPDERRLPPFMFIDVGTTTRYNTTKSNVNYRPPLWFQPQYKKGDTLWALRIRRREFPTALGSTGRRPSHPFHTQLEKRYPIG